MKGNLKKYSDGWFIESIVDDNGVKLPHPSRIRVHPEQLTNDDPYRSKYGVDDEVYFEVRTIAMGDSEFNVMDEDVAMIIERKVETPNEQEVITEKIVTEEQPKINDILSNLLDEPKMDYKIVSSTDSDKLSSEVKENMVNDWMPHGGLCVTSTGVFFQAMVKIN
jgi:hypothetical protein